MHAVEVDTVAFAFQDRDRTVPVIKNVSFIADEFEFVSVIGPSGCGKSTLLRIIAGLIPPTRGKILIYDKEVAKPTELVSFVFQDSALLPWLTNIENVKLSLSSSPMSEDEKNRKAKAILDRLELKGFENAYPNVLSGGMKQRVGVARAMVSDPKVLLMDEPFSSLDELTARSLRSEILSTLKDKNLPIMSVLMVSHNVEEVVELSDKVVILSDKPSYIKAIKTIDLPVPRDRHSKEFINVVDSIYSVLTG